MARKAKGSAALAIVPDDRPATDLPTLGLMPAFLGTPEWIPLEHLRESPMNPRRHFDPVALEQLGRNLLETGQLNACIARPSADGVYELAAGHRRYRAAKLVGITALLVNIVDMTDQQFIEVLNVENLQRDGLHPLEEADGFASLRDHAGYDVPRIAQRIGRSPEYVYTRLKLLALIPALRDLFLAKQFASGHAVQLARLTPDQQAHALGKPPYYYDGGLFQDEGMEGPSPAIAGAKAPGNGLKAVSVRELGAWIDETFKLDVDSPTLALEFPETAKELEAAKDTALAVVHITHDHHTDRDEMIIGAGDWKRADGTRGHAMCPHTVLGVVVKGEGRGQAFGVCLAKTECKKHWAAEQKAAARPATRTGGKDPARAAYDKQQAKWRAERAAYDKQQAKWRAERAKWGAAAPQLHSALGERIGKMAVTPSGPTLGLLLGQLGLKGAVQGATKNKGWRPGIEGVLQLAAVQCVKELCDGIPENIPTFLKMFGLDPKKALAAVQTSTSKGAKKAQKR